MQVPLQPLSLAFQLAPVAVSTEVLVRLFNHLLRGQAIVGELHALDGKRLAIDIVDTATALDFTIRGGRLYRSDSAGRRCRDVCIRGRLEHFWQLASRQEDPDTLFFNRQLEIEGETETGLYIKNLLDSLDYDWDSHFQAVLGERLGAVPVSLWRSLR
ncbi:ubiquinone anaerobic biosynthesis accessory factor UbiT [Chromatocurvus halotolerans]|uniref:Ubiquinone biosynthesis accessory factor UbiT n=1 Tax=Chromatocurvus halotolerans TaxID=1132028 RepID=A0A4R2KR00_9GAMM|nr:SCP2 sterol-binding domain-containing protein [Chromatocurvus halotolerans]TCO76074.1 putative lipid carrier protein YhbT [Chromatocurvus halotolerans]